jgi:hypothetical protein
MVLRTTSRHNIRNQRHEIVEEEEKRWMFPTFKPGKYSQASTVSAPSIRRLVESTRRDRNKGVLVTAPTLEKGEGEIRNSIGSFSNQRWMLFI